jgi:ABC-type multidrug transport system ATPase subunit
VFDYDSIRGIAEREVRQLVDYYLRTLQLSEHANKQVQKYSGGNKRKLSLAIALIGSPRILFLDEPSCGMDPSSRRSMWHVLSSEKHGRSTILTTHSMAEADFLCSRIGIMVNGKLKCLGSSQYLKSSYGSGYEVMQVIHSLYCRSFPCC